MVVPGSSTSPRHPVRPWVFADLDRCLATVEQMAGILTPVPAELIVDDFATEFATWPAFWGPLVRSAGGPGSPPTP